MNKLSLVFPLILAQSCLPEGSSNTPYDVPPVICAVGSASQSELGKGISGYFQSSAIVSRQDYPPEMKITLNQQVVYDSCADTYIDGMNVYGWTGYVAFNLSLNQNEVWRDEYFSDQDQPKKWGIGIAIETKKECSELSWQPVVPETAALLDWKYSEASCSPAGYYAALKQPLTIDETNQTQ